MKEKLSKTLSIIALVLIILLTSVLTLKNILYFEIEIVGSSMKTTLNEGETGLALKSNFIDEIESNDIIIFKRDNKEVIKRVIGKPFDHIKINRDGIYINEILIEEDYLSSLNKDSTYLINGIYNDITLKEDEYFVLGDNRIDSLDSRSYGPIKEENITGKLTIIFPSKYGEFRKF